MRHPKQLCHAALDALARHAPDFGRLRKLLPSPLPSNVIPLPPRSRAPMPAKPIPKQEKP